jgi:hypothetical protein
MHVERSGTLGCRCPCLSQASCEGTKNERGQKDEPRVHLVKTRPLQDKLFPSSRAHKMVTGRMIAVAVNVLARQLCYW